VGGTWLVYREREALLASEQPLPAALRTSCPELAKEFERLARVARSPHVPVLILGDSGAGKELVARAVHEVSERKGAFVPINCGALPEDLIESQLFGHRKGAFSGATEHQSGLARTAHEGTLFLDEVAELSPQAQVKLLRMLQENEVLPVGATRPVKVDVRVVAATNQPLEARVEAGAFRSDLYARLVGYRFRVPALRDRIEDLGMLTCALLTELVGASRANELTLHREAAQRLFAYDWPLNIRELQHALAAAVALTDGTQIEPEALPPELQRTTPSRAPPSMDETEFKHHLIALLEKHKGNVSGVARQMGKARAQIHRWCKRFDIAPESFR
jgi:DNA-binding NtrC family response regulator